MGLLTNCCYGTRNAGTIWEAVFYGDSLVSLGFLQGKASPCVFWHPTWLVSVVVHGDDFTALGTDDSLDLYEAGLLKCFDLKLRGRLGEGIDDLKEIRLLNRIIPLGAEGLTYEADPRHAKLLGRALGAGFLQNQDDAWPEASRGP